ncbi:MAG: protein adenylyltransferase SelO [Planctomycetaceae bacterium]
MSDFDFDALGWNFDNSYARLASIFFTAAMPPKFPSPQIAVFNHLFARELGLDFSKQNPQTVAGIFSGQILPNDCQPLAQAYAGHQYGHFTMLGDGRAILLGEHVTPQGNRFDVQLKGAGQTHYSRRGDGRAALGPMLREYIISEAMASLGILTTRSLAVVTTGETIYRMGALSGAVLTRIAASHIRVGTFEYAARFHGTEAVQNLADYTIDRHYPDLSNTPQKYLQFLESVIDRQASLIAKWQLVGFVHGVMNTDNMAISGETIDYGPCAFMNAYHPETVFSSIDNGGRYSYGNQPAIAQWNLARFAETLLPLIHSDEEKSVSMAMELLHQFKTKLDSYWLSGMRKKLGLECEEDEDDALVQALLHWMQYDTADFTNTFRDLSEGKLDAPHYQNRDFQSWYTRWQQRLQRENRDLDDIRNRMCAVNPAVIPRNHRVEEALSAAETHNDYSYFQRLLTVLSSPFQLSKSDLEYREPSPDDAGYQTFCGT